MHAYLVDHNSPSTSTDADYEKKQWCKKFDKRQPPKSRQYPQDAAYSLIPPQRTCECGRSRGVTISRGILVRKRQLARTVNYLKLTSSTTSQILRSTYATNNDGNPSHHFLSTFCLVFIIIIIIFLHKLIMCKFMFKKKNCHIFLLNIN